MKVVKPRQKRPNDPVKLKKQRNGLLSKIHIAKAQLGILDCDYRQMLQEFYRVKSAKDLGIEEMQDLVSHFEAIGWKPKFTKDKKKSQLFILRAKIYELASELPNGRRRLRGLARKLCGVDSLQWADASSLKWVLVVLERIKRERGSDKT